jgi:integrase
MDYASLVDEYIKSKRLAWARTSQKNERSRLNKHAPCVLEDPADVYDRLKATMKPYSIKTLFVRLGLFYQWMIDNDKVPPSKNHWKQFMASHANLFKHAYQTERLTVTYAEARERIETIDEPWRTAALQLLEGGLRSCELRTFDGECVIGKGSKPRTVFFRDDLKTFRYTGCYSALYKRLKAVGLKPHTLRKLCATEFGNQDKVGDMDMLEVFGWNSIDTSKRYRQPKRRDQLKEMLQRVVAGAKPEKPQFKIDIKKILARLLDEVKV